MNIKQPVFKFLTLRSPEPRSEKNKKYQIFPDSEFVQKLVKIIQGKLTFEKKVDKLQVTLKSFIDSRNFISDSKAFKEPLNFENCLDNIVVRILTQENKDEIFRALVDQVKRQFVKDKFLEDADVQKVKIIIPKHLILTKPKQKPESNEQEDEADKEIQDKLKQIQKLEAIRKQHNLAIDSNVIGFDASGKAIIRDDSYAAITDRLNVESISIESAKTQIDAAISEITTSIEGTGSKIDDLIGGFSTEAASADNSNEGGGLHTFSVDESKAGLQPTQLTTQFQLVDIQESKASVRLLNNELQLLKSLKSDVEMANKKGVSEISAVQVVDKSELRDLNEFQNTEAIAWQDLDKEIIAMLDELYNEFYSLIPNTSYTYIGEKWVDTTKFESQLSVNEATKQYSLGVDLDECTLKYPIQIADLRVVEHETVGYLPGEIAHINNTQPGEKHKKKTRRLKRVDSYESIDETQETFKETDSQSTEKFGVEQAASQVQSEEQNVNVNASVSASYGVVKASVDAGYSNSNSVSNSDSSASTYAKEVVESVVERVSNSVRTQRSSRSVEEFEQTVTHLIDNTESNEPKSYVYRWLNKLSRATLKNYGKRLIFNFRVAHPAHDYLSRSLQDQPKLNIPPDPKTLHINGQRIFKPELITRENFLNWAELYSTELELPPETKLLISDNLSTEDKLFVNKLIPIKKGYQCKRAIITNTYGYLSESGSQLRYIIGQKSRAYYNGKDDKAREFLLNDETENLSLAIFTGYMGMIFSVEVEVRPTQETMRTWQLKCYQAILDGFDELKLKAESQMTEWDPNLPGIHPAKKKEIINTELKKAALGKMFRCNPFYIRDEYKVGKEYQSDCCLDDKNAERVEFLESVFDWNNMTFELHPYIYADKDNWAKLLNLSDDDPMFESFLQSSFASIRVPVFRDSQKELAAMNFMMTNTIANYETLPEGMEEMFDDIDGATEFELDENGNSIPKVKETEIGVFQLPTTLVILECGTVNGVKPIGFPQSKEAPNSAVEIPQQFSPAIIADSCPETPKSE